MTPRFHQTLKTGCLALAFQFTNILGAQDESASETIDDEVVTLDAFVVSADAIAPDDWLSSEAVSGTRTASPIIELPFSVQVITDEFLNSFQLRDLDEFGTFISSFAPGEVESGGGGGNLLRGFTPPTFLNGFPRTGVGEVVNIDRVEIIKGPMSALYGRAEPGGIINYVTKRPEATAKYSLLGSIGTYDYQREEVHATGPVIANKLFYRVDASYMETGAEMDYYFQHTKAISTSWMYTFSKDTSLTVDFEYMDRKSNTGAVTLGKMANTVVTLTDGSQTTANLITGTYLPLIDFNIWGPYATTDREIYTLNAQFEHRINDVWSLRVNGQYWDRNLDDDRWTTPQYQINTGLYNAREPYLRTLAEDSAALQSDLLAHFMTGEIEHKFLITTDYSNTSAHDEDFRYSTADKALLPSGTLKIDPENPVWVRTERDKFTVQKTDEKTDTDNLGVFVSERMALFNGTFIALVGGRYDWVNVDFNDAIADVDTHYDAKKFTYMTGLTWRIINDKLVAFCNSSTSFNGTPIIDEGTNEFLGFSQGKGVEAGFKGLAFNGDFSYTFSLYTIRRNEPDTNPDYTSGDDVPQYLGKVEERVRGIELELYYKAIKDITIYGSVGIMDSEILTADGEAGYTDAEKLKYRSEIGEQITRCPGLNYSYAVRYALPIKGLSTGASVSYTGSRIIDDGYRITVRARQENAGYTLVNAYIAYTFDALSIKHSLRFNLLNLCDETYYTATGRLGKGIESRLTYSISF
jgi:iron complex outermembrane recepter protein